MTVSSVQLCHLRDHHDLNGSELRQFIVTDIEFLALLWRHFPFVYRLPDRSGILSQVCRERKWKVWGDPEDVTGNIHFRSCHQSWNLSWRPNLVVKGRTKFYEWQIVNHIPNATNYCRKDVLVRYSRRMKATFGNIFEFCPPSFNLPTEFSQLVSEHRKRKGECNRDSEKVVWIAKPVGKSQGRGIFLFERCSELRYDDQFVVQLYIHRPLLINGYKWDLRLYVVITCTNPLTVYAYEEGIARFATKRYDLINLGDSFSHLTNTSLNKQSPEYYRHKETVGLGSKWTLFQLREYFKQEGIPDFLLWQRIWSILVLTVVGEGRIIAEQKWGDRGFQFLGFDILVDCNMKPHLLEVNVYPGLGADRCSKADNEVKIPMLHDLFDLLSLPDGRKIPDPETPKFMDSANEVCRRIMEASNSSDKYPQTHTALPRRNNSFSTKKRNPHKLSFPCALWPRIALRQGQSKNKIGGQHDEIHAEVDEVDANNNLVMSVNKSQEGKASKKEYHALPIPVRLPTLKKSQRTLSLPLNGPGLTFPPRNWKIDPPISCGKWVRVFPFDKTTAECAMFARSTDSNACIARIGNHVNAVKDVIPREGVGITMDDHYDQLLRKNLKLSTKVWHPR